MKTNDDIEFMVEVLNSDKCKDQNKYYCTVCDKRIDCDQIYKWGTDARTPQH